MKVAKALLILFCMTLALSPQCFAGTCALCRQALAIGGGDGLVKGIYWSILLIAGMPFLLICFFVYMYYRGQKHSKKVHDATH